MTDTPVPGAAGTTGANGEALKADADVAKQAAEHDLADAKDQVKEDLQSLTETARQDFEDARRAATHYAEDRKNDAAGQVEGVATAVRRVADDLETGESPLIGRYARELSDGLDRFSRNAQSQSLSQMAGEVERFGRERPGVFLAGAALLGFASSRFLAASGSRQSSDQTGDGSADARSHGDEVSGRYTRDHPARSYADNSRAASSPALNAGKEDI